MSQIRRVFFLFSLAVVIGTFTIGAVARGTANVSLSVDKQAFASGEAVRVTVTISNPERGSIRLLKWYTPADDVEESLFRVTRDGVPVEFIGPHYKRPEPTDRDFIVLKSGESLVRNIDLADYHDLSVTGAYSVAYDVKSLDLYGKNDAAMARVQDLNSNGLQVWIEGRAAKRPEAQAPSAVSGASSYTKCTTTQQSQGAAARNEASTYASDSLTYLMAGFDQQGLRYATWFGAKTTTRYNKVSSNFTNIKGAMDTASVNFNCGCKKQYYAYVYPNQPYNIYLCRIYWTAPLTGTDSKAGTLIHEMSHFTIVAGTDDWVYGQSGARNLATTNPDHAVDNADSHEYFAENTPFQP